MTELHWPEGLADQDGPLPPCECSKCKPVQNGTEATAEDRAALVRCNECWEDGERADLSIAALHRLADLGWIEKVDRRLWQISPEGMAVLEAMEAASHG